MSFIEIKNLTIDSSMDGINFTAVNNISLNIEKGTKVAILGESGAGKSLITKYGASTTWMGKLEYRLKSRRNGGCPILAIGIKKTCVEGY